MEKSQTNLSAVQRFYDAYNKKNEAILSEVIADDYVDYGHEPPGRGIQGCLGLFIRYLPQITHEELNEMKGWDPKSEADPTHF